MFVVPFVFYTVYNTQLVTADGDLCISRNSGRQLPNNNNENGGGRFSFLLTSSITDAVAATRSLQYNIQSI